MAHTPDLPPEDDDMDDEGSIPGKRRSRLAPVSSLNLVIEVRLVTIEILFFFFFFSLIFLAYVCATPILNGSNAKIVGWIGQDVTAGPDEPFIRPMFSSSLGMSTFDCPLLIVGFDACVLMTSNGFYFEHKE
jgi:hypothetical protein